MATNQINTARRSLSQSSDEGYKSDQSDQDSQKRFNLGHALLIGDALGEQETGGIFNMGLGSMVREMIDGDGNTDQPNQVQPAEPDSDSSSAIEEEEQKRQEAYELPVMYSKSFVAQEKERVVAFTDIFMPDTKKLRENVRLYNERASGKVQDLDNEETRAKRRKLKSDYKILTAGLIHKANYLAINPYLEDFYYLKNINKQGVPQKKLAQQTQDIYRTLLPEKEKGALLPNRLIATIARKTQPKHFSRETRAPDIQEQSQAHARAGTEGDSDIDSVIDQCRVEEMREHFIKPTPFQNGKNSLQKTCFPAPKYSEFEKQIYAFQKGQDECGQPLTIEQISNQMMQEWTIEQKFAQLTNNGSSVKRTKFWGELQDASSIQQLEKDYHVFQKYEHQSKPPLRTILQQQDVKMAEMRVVENLQEYEIIKTRNEQYKAPKKSQVTAASIMRLIRFKMGSISEEKYYELEMKDLNTNKSQIKRQQKNKEDDLAAFDENLDVHFKNKQTKIRLDYSCKKELKDRTIQQSQNKPVTNAYNPISNAPQLISAQKLNNDDGDQAENNKVEGNSETDNSSSSENDEDTPNRTKFSHNVGQVTQTMGEELNHAKCIEGHSYYKLDWNHKDLQHFHRPDIQACFEMEQSFQIPALVKNQKSLAVEDRLNPHEYFKEKDKLSLKRGKFCLFEHVDQHPLFVNNFGMASRLKRYFYGDRVPTEKIFKFGFQNKETQHMGPYGQIELKGAPKLVDSTKPELGIEPKQHLNLLGQINTSLFKGLAILENKMFNTPVYFQKPNDTDFFCSITKSVDGKDQRIWIREMENNIYSVGQIEPKLEVYNPQSRDFQNFIKKRCKAYIIRLLEENGRDSVMFSDIQKLFPNIRDQILKNGMKETEIEIDRNQYCNFNPQTYQQERFNNRMTPEMICQYESACHGQYRLERLGITEILGADKISYSTNKFNREESDITLRRIAKLIEKDVLSTPWNLSQSYIKVKQTQEMMMVNGDGDPSYGHGGYSFLKMPLKISADSLEGAKQNRMNLNPAIKNPKAVTRTDADLRKLKKEDIFDKLKKKGFSEEYLKDKSRWEGVGLLRHSADNDSENQKYQRGVRYTSDKQRQQYINQTNEMFEKQMKTLSLQNFNGGLMSEDEPDFIQSDLNKFLNPPNQGRNATDYSEEIKSIAKDTISKLSVECAAEEFKEIQIIEDIPNYLNLLLIKLDRMPPVTGMQPSGITMAGSSSAMLKAEELESLPPESLEQCKKELVKQLQENKITKQCEILCLKIRNLNQLNDFADQKFNKVLFFSSEKIIKKFNRYRNKNLANAINHRKPRNQNQRAGLTAEQIRQNQEVKSGGDSTTSKPIKQQEALRGAISIVSGSQPGVAKQQKRKMKAKEEKTEPFITVVPKFTKPALGQDPTQLAQQNQSLKIQIKDMEDPEVTPSDATDKYQGQSASPSVNYEEEKSEEYTHVQQFAKPVSRQPKPPKLKRQPSAVARFKNVGVSREDFAYENPTNNLGSMRRRQQQSDQALNEIFKTIITHVMNQDTQKWFHNKVTNREAPGYSQIVQQPICLKDIYNKTKQNAYKKSGDFLSDLTLMSDNSNKYNRAESLYSVAARSLVDLALQELDKKRDEILNLEGILENAVQ